MANNEKILCWLRKTWLSLRILGLIAALLIGVGIAYAEISANSKAVEKTTIKADANEKTLIGMGKDIEYIKRGIDDIKKAQKGAIVK